MIIINFFISEILKKIEFNFENKDIFINIKYFLFCFKIKKLYLFLNIKLFFFLNIKYGSYFVLKFKSIIF